MALTQKTVRDRARVEAGNPKTEDLADSTIDEFISDCLDKIGEYIPNWAIFDITTVIDKQDYSVDAEVIDILFCDWMGTVKFSTYFDTDFAALDYQVYDVEMDRYKQLRDYLALEQIKNLYDWQFREADKKLFLIPPPQTVGDKVYYIGVKAWTLADCPSRFERYVVWYSCVESLKAVARKKRRLTAVVHTGNIVPWSMADPQLADARKLEFRFYDAMRKEARKALF